ncbi:MAG: hypothetical protein KatS3mg091_499 [Patescibacteria group bacterium]|nr:MAG: hypothetical protein KatS3mg091_499 [Patescibacteria group bacterium]
MDRLKTLLQTIDKHLLPALVWIFFILIPLYPKLPLMHVNFTYIAIRLEDLYFALLSFVFLIYLIRKKISINKKILIYFLLYWLAIFISYIFGLYFFQTIHYPKLGFLHTLRRVEYMLPFFYTALLIGNTKDLLKFLKVGLTVALIVCLYGLGQKFLGFPAVQTMNDEYSKGLILRLTPEARVSSTFGGHYDLAAYLVFFIPIIIALNIYTKQKRYFLLLVLAIYMLILTSSRISFIAYIVSVSFFLLFFKKIRYLLLVILITAVLTVYDKTIIERFSRTIQVKQVVKTNQEVYIPQEIRPDELPAGSFNIETNLPILKKIAEEKTSKQDLEKAQKKAIEDLAVSAGFSTAEARIIAEKKDLATIESKIKETNNKSLLNELNKLKPIISEEDLKENRKQAQDLLKPATAILTDISFATRIQVEWPRAIGSFLTSPLIGLGASTITEATDNSYLRSLGEFGLLGTVLYFYLLLKEIGYKILNQAKKLKSKNNKMHLIYFGFCFGILALLINATYIDVFEASKVAFMLWMVAGAFYKSITINRKQKI